MDPYSVYLHIPFCRRRCGYCDFNTTTGLDSYIPDYTEALCREIKLVGTSAGQRLPVHTIYFGGGTPSLIPAAQYEKIISALKETYALVPDAEISLEANPGTVTRAYLSSLRELGFNRISFGMQSANADDLALLERCHTFEDTIQAVKWARKAGFQNLNLDLIYGLPGQTVERWQESLARAVDLQSEHLSLYALTIEPGTLLEKKVAQGLVQPADDDLAADHYEAAAALLETAGYRQYEISNWAKIAPDGRLLACIHNLQYWRNLPYLGFGAGAHGCAAGVRVANVSGLVEYIQRCQNARDQVVFPQSPARESAQKRDLFTEMQETLMLGLRLTEEGVSRAAFLHRFNRSMEVEFKKEIELLTQRGLLEWGGEDADHLRLTRRARLLGNQVFMYFVPDQDEEN